MPTTKGCTMYGVATYIVGIIVPRTGASTEADIAAQEQILTDRRDNLIVNV